MDKSLKKSRLIHLIGQQYSTGEIREMRVIDDICTLRLRNGQLFMARLSRSGDLILEELDGVC